MQSELAAGDTFNYVQDIAAYPPSAGWTAKLRFTPRSSRRPATTLTATATVGADTFTWLASAAVTAVWDAGEYSWAVWVEKAGQRYTALTGQITVLPDPSALVPGTDTRSQAARSLDAINAFLEGRASDAQLRYKINGRELERYPLQDVLRLKQHFESAVAGERLAKGLAGPRGGVQRILMRTP